MAVWGASAGAVELSPVQVLARAYSSTQCQYYHSSVADFDIRYTLPEGSQRVEQITIVYGFEEESAKQSFVGGGRVPLASLGKGRFQTKLNGIVVDQRGGIRYGALQFYLEVKSANGALVIDRGGRGFSSYAARIPERQCAPGALEPITLDRVHR